MKLSPLKTEILRFISEQGSVTTLDLLRWELNKPDISTSVRRRTNELAKDFYLINDIVKINNKDIARFKISEKGRVYLLRLNQKMSPYEESEVV